MTASATNSATSASQYNSQTAKTDGNVFSNGLSKDDFLKLLITELKYQDAMNPMEDREFIAQMAQISGIEQMQNLNKTMEESMEALLATQMGYNNLNMGLSLLGKEATYITADSVEKTGTVSAVKQKDGYYVAVINNSEVPLANIKIIR